MSRERSRQVHARRGRAVAGGAAVGLLGVALLVGALYAFGSSSPPEPPRAGAGAPEIPPLETQPVPEIRRRATAPVHLQERPPERVPLLQAAHHG